MTKIELPYSNEIGHVDYQEVRIERFLAKKHINMSDVKRIGLYKRSSLRKNIFIYLVSFALLVYYLLNLNQLGDLQGILTIVTVIIGFFYAFFGKFYHYTLVFHCKGYIVKFRYAESKKEPLQMFQQAINSGIQNLHPEMFPEFDNLPVELNS